MGHKNAILLMMYLWMIISYSISAQVGIGTNNPNASSGLDVNFADKGLLAPRMTTAQREAIIDPAEGLFIYNITTGCFNYFHSNAWYEWCGSLAPFICGTSKVRSTYSGTQVTYNTVTGANDKCWLDRNLGAAQVATSSSDASSYGDLFEWGRLIDGHQLRTSLTTYTSSSSDVPGHGKFILALGYPYDWRSPQNSDLWQGVDGTNNPCPAGFRLPTLSEWDTERQSWNENNASGAFASPLKLPMAGLRNYESGEVYYEGSNGSYWCSTINDIYSLGISFSNEGIDLYNNYSRANGMSVRCIKD